MMHIVFYILLVFYYLQSYLNPNFNPVGIEFANLVILGLLTIITMNGDKK